MKRVSSGQPFRIPAEEWNQIVDFINSQSVLPTQKQGNKTGLIRFSPILNSVEAGDLVKLDSIEMCGENIQIDFVFRGEKLSSESEHVAVVNDFVSPGNIGGISITGIVYAKVQIVDLLHTACNVDAVNGRFVTAQGGTYPCFIPTDVSLGQVNIIPILFVNSKAGSPIVWIQPSGNGSAVYDVNGVVVGHTYLGTLYSQIGSEGLPLSSDKPFFIPVDVCSQSVNLSSVMGDAYANLRLASVSSSIACKVNNEIRTMAVYSLIDTALFIR